MTKAEVIALMRLSTDVHEWNANREKVKAACHGYPTYWYEEIVQSGLMREVLGLGPHETEFFANCPG
jgi:hypothetical protein